MGRKGRLAKPPRPQGAPMTLREAAAFLRINDQVLRRYVREKKIRVYRLGTRGDLRFFEKDLVAFLQPPT